MNSKEDIKNKINVIFKKKSRFLMIMEEKLIFTKKETLSLEQLSYLNNLDLKYL